MKTKQRVTPQFTERYQWKANREGGQRIGNKQTIAPLTSDLFYRYLADGVRPNKFFEYRREYPNVTHISLVERVGWVNHPRNTGWRADRRNCDLLAVRSKWGGLRR